MRVIKDGTVTTVPKFKAIGVKAGIRNNGASDLALIYSELPCVTAGIFSKNSIKAAHIVVNKENLKSDYNRAIVINSAYANTCTGSEGIENSKKMCKLVAKKMDIDENEVLVASTGRIGIQLPMDRIENGINMATKELSYDGGLGAAEAIMTTDTYLKNLAIEFDIGGERCVIGAIAKGSGMVQPNMGTILSFITTNVNISKEMLQRSLRESGDISYNMISIDGDTSTNDTALIMSNCTARNKKIECSNSEEYEKFKFMLDYLNIHLSKEIARDGEGATKLIEVIIQRGKSEEDCRKCAKAVVNSSLVKSAFFGRDANWGRIVCALGYSGAEIDGEKIDITFENAKGSILVVKNGQNNIWDGDEVFQLLKEESVTIIIDLKDGEASATAWGCDLTYDYIKINGYYRS